MNEHESGPLDDSPEALSHAAMLLRNRRLMRRAYARAYSSDDAHPLPAPEPVLEQSGFAPRDPDAEQAEFLAKRDPVKDAYWFGAIHGFCVALGGVLVLTGVLLWKGMP